MAYTLQVGREAMEERLGLVVSSVEQLAERLEAYVHGELKIDDFYQGQVKRGSEALLLFSRDADLQQTVEKWMANKKFSKLLELWVKGLELDWNKLYDEVKPQRIGLPTYPFARDRYWIETAASYYGTANGRPAADLTTSVLHPLLHRNTSDLNEQRYSTTFTGKEFFLADHQLRMDREGVHKVLPGVAYLEMARAAVEQARPGRRESRMLELRHAVWQPIEVTQEKQVSIALWGNEKEEIEFEIYSVENGEEMVHGQGRWVWREAGERAGLDLEQLKGKMGRGGGGEEFV